MIRRPPRSTLSSSSAASDVYKRQVQYSSQREYSPSLFSLQRTTSPPPSPSSRWAASSQNIVRISLGLHTSPTRHGNRPSSECARTPSPLLTPPPRAIASTLPVVTMGGIVSEYRPYQSRAAYFTNKAW
eukprot:TRINITY_DN4534_c0_g1_i3.p1 TRINITY_DN4534_c0_g1~~TRINITY_DN4534_c0_g1_i3.p1  ORF type:complete len:129 (+),score=7.56 TRINITY_DN4534_c0_g1_i3:139-525(+)